MELYKSRRVVDTLEFLEKKVTKVHLRLRRISRMEIKEKSFPLFNSRPFELLNKFVVFLLPLSPLYEVILETRTKIAFEDIKLS